MAQVSIFIPREYMLGQVQDILKTTNYENVTVHEVMVVQTADVLNKARQAIEDGTEIIMARGLQALYIKEHTRIPVVEIMMTGQELALLVIEAKKKLGKKDPHIAFVGNIFSDMSHFEELYGITLSLYNYNNAEEHLKQLRTAVRSGADIVIGGDLLNKYAHKNNVPSLLFKWPWQYFAMSVKQTILPVFCLALNGISSRVRQTCSSMLEVIRQDYIRTARSKGLKTWLVIVVHALKNALIPVLHIFHRIMKNMSKRKSGTKNNSLGHFRTGYIYCFYSFLQTK